MSAERGEKMVLRIVLSALVLALGLASTAAADNGRRLVIVTLDGLHWRELFQGADPARAANRAFVSDPTATVKAYVEAPDRARHLMPFLHDVVAREGVLLGNRDQGSCVKVANDQWFSYPGYNEILTGRPDPAIRSNAFGPNPNITLLEWLNGRPGFVGRVQAVTSWSIFADILNVGRSKLPVNAGWGGKADPPADPMLARLEAGAPRHWPTVRLDTFTQAHALAALKTRKPRVLYVAYGETDDFAHDGRYDLTLEAARRTDGFIAELWTALQANPAYAGRTTMILTTDHGRGEGRPDAWKNHGKPLFVDSDAAWIGVLGPGVRKPAASTECATVGQVAATALTALGLDWRDYRADAAPPLDVLAPR